jgi:hypothetical protein
MRIGIREATANENRHIRIVIALSALSNCQSLVRLSRMLFETGYRWIRADRPPLDSEM